MNTKNTSMTPLVETVAQLERYVTSLIPKLQQAAQLGGQLASSMSGGAGGFVHGSQSMPQGIAQMAGSTATGSMFSQFMDTISSPVTSIAGGRRAEKMPHIVALENQLKQTPANDPMRGKMERDLNNARQVAAFNAAEALGLHRSMVTGEDINNLSGNPEISGRESFKNLRSEFDKHSTPDLTNATAKRKMMSGFYGASDELHREIARGNESKARALDVYDLEKIRKKSADFDTEGMQKDIQRIMATGTDSQKNIARVAERDLKKKSDLAAQYTKKEGELLAAQTSGADVDTIKQAQRALQGIGNALSDVTTKADKASKALKGFGGGEGGEPPMERFLRGAMQGAKIASGVVAAVGGAAMAYQAVQVAALQEGVGKERTATELNISRKGLSDTRFMEAFSLTNPDNMLKHRGDVLFPGRYNYLGKSGGAAAEDVANREALDRMGLSKAQMGKAGTSLLLGLAGGAASVAGGVAATGTSLGSAIGVPVAAAGVQGIISSFQNYFETQGTNEWSQLQGGIAGGAGGGAAYSPTEQKRRARLNAVVAANKFMLTKETMKNEMQQQELQNDPMGRMAAQQIQQMVDVQQQGAVLVGTHAWTRDEMLKSLYPSQSRYDSELYQMPERGAQSIGKASGTRAGVTGRTNRQALEERLTSAESLSEDTRDNRINRGQNFSGSVSAMYFKPNHAEKTVTDSLSAVDAARSALSVSIGIPYSPSEIRSRENWGGIPYSNEAWKGFPYAAKQNAFVEAQASAANVRETEASKRGMSIPEFSAKANMLENVVNTRGRASVAQTGQMIDMSRSGLGDFSALMGNVAGLNQVSGGQNNVEQLKSILSTAVSMGFDRSRTAQAFVQTSTQLADSLKLTRVDVASAGLKDTVRWQTATGMADEKALRDAASGTQQFAAITSSDSGYIGGYKAMSMMKRGASPRIMALMQGVDAVVAKQYQYEMKQFGNVSGGMDTNFTKDKRLQMLVDQAREDVLKENNIDIKDNEAREKFLKTQRAADLIKEKVNPILAVYRNPMGNVIKNYFAQGAKGADIAETMAEIKKLEAERLKGGLKGDALKTHIQRMGAATGALASSIMLIPGFKNTEVANKGMQDFLEVEGIIKETAPSRGGLGKTIRESANIYNDPAQVKMNQALGELMQRSGGATHWSKDEYRKQLDQASISAMPVKVGNQTIPLTSAVLDFMETGKNKPKSLGDITQAELKSAGIEGQIGSISKIDAARSAEFQAKGEGTTSVWVANPVSIAEAIVSVQKMYNTTPPPTTPKAEGAKGEKE